MNRLRACAAGLGVAAGLLFVSASGATERLVLITADEAKLPAPQHVAWSRGITRAPRIQVAEAMDGRLHSPIHFKLGFRAFGGSTIDTGSLVVTYLRRSDIDLTPRLRSFVTPSGIDIPEAEVPPGDHIIRVVVHDSEGREGVTTFSLNVVPE
jgi:hypothetical protein